MWDFVGFLTTFTKFFQPHCFNFSFVLTMLLAILGLFCLLAARGGGPGDGSPIRRSVSDPPSALAAGGVPYGGERLSIALGDARSAGHRPYTLEHSYVKPCAELFDAPLALFFCSPRGKCFHFRPTSHRRRLIVIVALLLRSGIESNP